MLQPFFPRDGNLPGSWEELGEGAPTLIALARLCSEALVRGTGSTRSLSKEAEAILFAARHRGVIEVRGVNDAFEAPDRFLAVRVELDAQRTLTFRNREEPQVTIRFFDAFRQLCEAGFVMHHLYRDFSLSQAGFERAQQIRESDVRQYLAQGYEFGLDA
jgi:hypothetical protein